MAEARLAHHHIYFAKPVGRHSPVKIGWSRRPETRVRQISVGSPHSLEVYCSWTHPDTRFLENALHRKYAARRLNSEWFDITTRVVDFEYSRRDRPWRAVEIFREADLANRLQVDPQHINMLLEFGADRDVDLLYNELSNGFIHEDTARKKLEDLLVKHVPL
jgi:hypothetical protein